VIEINKFPRQQRCLASPCAPVRCRAAGRTIAPLRLLNDGSPGGLCHRSGAVATAVIDDNHLVHELAGYSPDNAPDSCSGLQTVAPEPANKGRFRLTFHANKRRPGLTLAANEPVLHANSLQAAR
jgi:hypothetical protein